MGKFWSCDCHSPYTINKWPLWVLELSLWLFIFPQYFSLITFHLSVLGSLDKESCLDFFLLLYLVLGIDPRALLMLSSVLSTELYFPIVWFLRNLGEVLYRILKLFGLITEAQVIAKPEFQGMKWDIISFMFWGGGRAESYQYNNVTV